MEVPDPGGLDWHHWYGRANGIVREIGTFMTGIIEEEARFDRVLATVMFTDIVGSAAKAAELGDRNVGNHLIAGPVALRVAREGQARQRAVAAGREERQRVPAGSPSSAY